MVAPGVWVAKDALRFSAVRSSGPGGQNVNKRSTRVELRLALEALGLAPAPTQRLRTIASHLVTDADELVITSDEHRSQRRNREACLTRLREMVVAARVRPKVRRPTKPTAGGKRRRLEEKRRRGETKRRRRPPESE